MAETGKTLTLDLPDEDSQSLWFVTGGEPIRLDGELAGGGALLNERETTVLLALLDLARDRVSHHKHRLRTSSPHIGDVAMDRSSKDSS